MRMRWSAVVVAALTAMTWGRASATQDSVRIPFATGLTLAWAASLSGEPDYETILSLIRVDSAEATIRISWNRGDPRWKHYTRPLSLTERRRARSFFFYSSEEDASQYRGTTQSMVSSAIHEGLLRTGRAAVVLLMPVISARPFRGDLVLVGRERYPVLLDGRPVTLPGLRVEGRLEGEQTVEFSGVILDDADAPWVLLASAERRAQQSSGARVLVRITTAAGASGLGPSLERDCRVSLHGIHFATGSDELDQTSDPVLEALASVLRQHRDWRLTVIGHTDSVGTAASNLDLSERRAARVRSVLIQRHEIVADRLRAEGRGEREPVADNGTPAGRARNRRVDLVRPCEAGR